MQAASEGGNLVMFRYGGGSFGSVYKGTLPAGAGQVAIAVKKLEGRLCVGEKQFRNEVRTIGVIQHVNLVRLRGFSSHGSERLLMYDHMPNGSLDKALFGGAAARFQVALGAARGLLYLHEGCRDCIIHCDIKPENILLDEAFVPKVADFGLAKLMGRDFSRVLTTMRGTVGYLAPKWIAGTAITMHQGGRVQLRHDAVRDRLGAEERRAARRRRGGLLPVDGRGPAPRRRRGRRLHPLQWHDLLSREPPGLLGLLIFTSRHLLANVGPRWASPRWRSSRLDPAGLISGLLHLPLPMKSKFLQHQEEIKDSKQYKRDYNCNSAYPPLRHATKDSFSGAAGRCDRGTSRGI